MGKRPGYKRDKPIYKLIFADDQFNGLEVVAKSLPLGEFLELQKLQSHATEDPEAAEKIMRKLGDVLISWNLEDDDDQPVPATYDGLASQDLPFVLAIFQAWQEAVAGVPNPSPAASNGGGTFQEQSIPMEVP